MDAINVKALRLHNRSFVLKFENALNASLLLASQAAKDEVRDNSKFKRRSPIGKSLKDSTETRILKTRNGRRVVVKSTKKTASFLEFGTRARVITAKDKPNGKPGFLRFKGRGGGLIFRRSVKRKASRPYRFLSTATQVAMLVSRNEMGRLMNGLAKEY